MITATPRNQTTFSCDHFNIMTIDKNKNGLIATHHDSVLYRTWTKQAPEFWFDVFFLYCCKEPCTFYTMLKYIHIYKQNIGVNYKQTFSTRASHVVTHRTTGLARIILTSEIGRDRVHYDWYDRMWIPDRFLII